MKGAYLKAVYVALGLLVGLPMLAYAVLDVTQFQSRRAEVNTILQGAAPEDRHPPKQVVQMLRASERNGLSAYAARLLVRELKAIPEQEPMLRWHLKSALWWSFVRLHLSEEEQATVILDLAPTGSQLRGFTTTSIALYQRQPSELSPSEVATIVALIRQPSAKGSRLEGLRNMLLARYEAGT